jgi:hypothetical protein
MRRRGRDAALGLLVLAALLAALPLGLWGASGARDLRVSVRSPEPFEIAERPREIPLAPATAGPPSLLPRLLLRGDPDRSDPGLWLRTWQVVYGKRWEREVTFPVLAGPFDPEGAPWPCAIAARFSPRFFDDGKPGGEDVESVVDRVVRAQFPFSVMGLRFASVSSTSLHVRPVEGGVEVSGSVVLSDSSRDPTRFSLQTKIALGEKDGDLAARIERVSVRWQGRTRRDPLVSLASLFLDVDDEARRIVAGKLSGSLAIFKLPREPVAVFPERPGDRFRVRLCDAPDARPDGLTVRLALVATLAEPRVDPRVPGPPHLEAPPTLPPPRADAPTFEGSLGAAAVQQALYAMWQGGRLAAWGRDPRVLAAVRHKMGESLAFELGAIDARLPPTVVPDAGALRVRFGALDVGRSGARRVLAHGDVLARGRFEDGRLALAGTLSDLRVSCADGGLDQQILSPCFSDVVPALRDSGVTSEGLPLDLAVPDRLLRMSLVLGTELVLDGLEGQIEGSPPALRLRGEARLRRR